jgi:hypothetical protein
MMPSFNQDALYINRLIDALALVLLLESVSGKLLCCKFYWYPVWTTDITRLAPLLQTRYEYKKQDVFALHHHRPLNKRPTDLSPNNKNMYKKELV